MECPGCKSGKAYYGLIFIHCINTECYHYDARYVAKLLDEKTQTRLSALRSFINNDGED